MSGGAHPTRGPRIEVGDYLDLLDDAARKLLEGREPRVLIAELFELSREALGLDVYLNYLLRADGALHLAASYGLSDTMAAEGARLELGVAVCGRVAAQKRPCQVADVQGSADPQHALIRRSGLTSYACNPLLAGDALLGTLGFGRRRGPPFRADEIRFLSTLTRYVAIAHERLRTESTLAESERRLQAVLDNATVGIFFIDEQLRCAFMNAAAERLTGYAFGEIQGRVLHDVLLHTHPDGTPYPLEDCPIVQALPEGRPVTGEEEIIRKDGDFRPIAYTASPMWDDVTGTSGTVIEAIDIAERRRTEASRLLLIREVDHRARNALSVVQSIVQLARADTIAELREIILGRVSALGRAQGLLASERWEGASLRAVIEGELGAIAPRTAFEVLGQERRLAPEHVQPLGMIVHELATNAAKYGSLSVAGGQIRIQLQGSGLVWEECGGPPPRAPDRTGFGMKMMRQLARQIGSEISFEWTDTGLRARLISTPAAGPAVPPGPRAIAP